ncbi:MAG TPA: SOS response-associated peptidase [Candidatus Saccharimonadales bacterium]|nr:SOS response-associated peptidase [Candidatus Saccharimonadales bacterium]
MCGRYGFYKVDEFGERFGVKPPAFTIKDNYNAAPGQILPVIMQSEYGKTLEPMKWGMIPAWAKDDRIGYKMINARSETLFEKSAWRGPIKYHRCLVPARGFYEWDKIQIDGKAAKQPYYIRPEGQDLFVFAGVFDTWHDLQGNEIWSYAIVTTRANKEMSAIHDRQPVILKPRDEALWLEPSLQDRGAIEDILRSYDDVKWNMVEVSRDVNVIRNNDERLIYPINSQ